MAKTLYFYDLETSGISPREDRIMQFAGQRTDLELNPIGEPDNLLIRLSEDVLPDPRAILITGITPQQTIADGITEVEFLKIFHGKIATNDTIFTGYNSVRFDDEFMRYINYRNFYDPYEWQWKDGRGKWDLLDVVRMTRALRPEGINWPMTAGKSSNRLEHLTKANKISHVGAHDALADVNALIEVAKLIKTKQPKLFDFLLNTMTSKNNLAKIVNENDSIVYTSGKYDSDYEKTAIVTKLIDHPKRQAVLVYDLRYDPTDFAKLSVQEMVEAWYPKDPGGPRLPIKTMQYNRCPAIAPIGVIDDESKKRLKIDIQEVNKNFKILQQVKVDFVKKIEQALDVLDSDQDKKYKSSESSVDAQLYDGFFGENDKQNMPKVRRLPVDDLDTNHIKFSDKRLNQLLPLYKARNYRKSLSSEEIEKWEEHRIEVFFKGDNNSRMAKYLAQLAEMSTNPKLSSNDSYLLEELKLYAESIFPSTD